MFRGLKSLLTGIIAGTAIGVLFSPKKGEEFRKTLKKEIDDGGSGLSVVKDTLTKMGKDIKKSAKETYVELNENEKVKKVTQKAKEEMDKRMPAVKKEAKKQLKKAKGISKKLKSKLEGK